MKNKKYSAKNNYSSSSFLKFNNLNNKNEFKKNLEKISNLKPCTKFLNHKNKIILIYLLNNIWKIKMKSI